MNPLYLLLGASVIFGTRNSLQGAETIAPPRQVIIIPKPHSGPLRNPLMGFIGPPNGRHPYATLAREYVKWNTIENSASDTTEKLRAYANIHWKGVEQRNIKVIPRVFLEWPKGSSAEDY